MKQSKEKSDRRRFNPGRPKMEDKKIRFQLMIEKSYFEHFNQVAKSLKIGPQELGRRALKAFVPDVTVPLVMPPILPAPKAKKPKK